MDIIFMGNPSFAAVSLKRLIEDGHNIKAVFCNVDKKVGRKREIVYSEVKKLAIENNIDVYQPTTLKDDEVLNIIKELSPQLIVVVAYGKFLPKEIFSYPKSGSINLHGSLLPKLRGAAPIQRSIINGEKVTGLTTIYLEEEMDSGDIIDKVEVEIEDSDTSKSLFKKMGEIGANLLSRTVKDIENGIIKREKQNESEATYAPPLKKQEALIDFNDCARVVHNKIRGYYDWPKGYINYKGKKLTIIESELKEDIDGKAGEILSSKELIVGCKNGSVNLKKVQIEGKNIVTGREFLNGQRLTEHDMLN